MEKQRKTGTMLRLLGYLKGHWRGYTLGGLYLAAVEALTHLLVALLLKTLVDASLAGDLNRLLQSLLFSGVSLITVAVFYPVASRTSGRAVEKAIVGLRQTLFTHLQQLPLSYHEKNHSGDAVSRISNDVTIAKNAINISLFTVISLLLSALVAAVYIALINWKLLILAAAILTASTLHNRRTGTPMRQVSSGVQSSQATLNERLKDMLQGMPIIRAFNLEQCFAEQYAAANAATRQQGMQMVQKQLINSTGNKLFGSSTFMGLLAFASYLMLQGEISPGDVVATVQLSNAISNPIYALGDLWANVQNALGAADRVFQVLDEPVEQLTAAASEEVRQATEDVHVSLHQVSFSYGTGQPVLQDVNLQVASGQVVAFVGPSGGGKSTLFKLLLGFYEADFGECRLWGRPLAHFGLEELREQIAFVPQDSYLFTGTIYQNIAYGREGASREDIIAAARAANAHDFVCQLAAGYETQVGERGAQLSGGQRQRIAIARALLKDAPLLLLDEATSSLDSESEQLVQEALVRLMQGRTTLVIAHRLSTIEAADSIHVVAAGRVVESGTHQELLQLDGLYRQLYEVQLKTA